LACLFPDGGNPVLQIIAAEPPNNSND